MQHGYAVGRGGQAPAPPRPDCAALRCWLRILLAGLLALLPVTSLHPAAHAALPPGRGARLVTLRAPRPPASATTFAWLVRVPRPRDGGPLAAVQLSGCWSAREVVRVTTNRRSVRVRLNRGTGAIIADHLAGTHRRFLITVTFTTRRPSANAHAHALVTMARGHKTRLAVGGPSCRSRPTPTATATATAMPTTAPTATATPSPTVTDTVTPLPTASETPAPPTAPATAETTATGTPTPSNAVPVPCSGCYVPSLNTSWQWQLSGTVDQSVNASMYDIDLFDNSASVVSALHDQGRKVTCYLDAGTWENWRPDATQFPASVLGNPVPDFPGEQWLDIRQLAILGPLMESRLDLCKAKGFDSVQFDNVDGYNEDTGFPLTASDQLRYNEFLANAAHVRGLSAALTDDHDQVPQLLPYFDWALDEECFEDNECSALTPFIDAGKAVMEVEYNRTPDQFCAQANAMNFNALYKDTDLDAYRVACR